MIAQASRSVADLYDGGIKSIAMVGTLNSGGWGLISDGISAYLICAMFSLTEVKVVKVVNGDCSFVEEQVL